MKKYFLQDGRKDLMVKLAIIEACVPLILYPLNLIPSHWISGIVPSWACFSLISPLFMFCREKVSSPKSETFKTRFFLLFFSYYFCLTLTTKQSSYKRETKQLSYVGICQIVHPELIRCGIILPVCIPMSYTHTHTYIYTHIL